jgi:aspartyl-tRNA synthetase
VIFVDLRDRDGLTQVVFHEDVGRRPSRAEVRPEYVIAVEGNVARGPSAVSPNLATGAVEVVASKIWILNESRTPPFPMEEQVDVAEDVRLKYRYVDLRRPHAAQHHPAVYFLRRARVSLLEGFLEIKRPS